MIKLVYISGRFTAPTTWAIEQNIRRAEEAGMYVAECGAMPIIPHANTRFFHGLAGTPEKLWYEGTLELLRRCDAVVMVSGYETSKGAMAEYEEALRLRIPRFFVVDDRIDGLDLWLRDGTASRKRIPGCIEDCRDICNCDLG